MFRISNISGNHLPDIVPQHQTGSILHLSHISSSQRGPSPTPGVPDLALPPVEDSVTPGIVSTNLGDLNYQISHILPQSAWRSPDQLENCQQGLSRQHQCSVPSIKRDPSLSNSHTSDLTNQFGPNSNHEETDCWSISNQRNQTPGHQLVIASNSPAYITVPNV